MPFQRYAKGAGSSEHKRGNVMRVLVAFEEEYRTYQDVTATIIRELRPHVEVSVAGLDELETQVARLVPGLVICSRSKNSMDADGAYAWLKLPTGHGRTAELCVNEECSEVVELGLEELLRILDEIEMLIRA